MASMPAVLPGAVQVPQGMPMAPVAVPAAVAGGADAAPDPASNPKTQLNNFLQRHLRTMVTKADVTYSVQQFGQQFQATVTLHNLNGMQFAGAIAESVKEAEQNAAKIALDHHSTEVAAQASEPVKKTKKKKSSEGGGPPPGQKGCNKMILNTALSRILRRPLTKEDITFNSRPVPGGWQATLTMPGLPGSWAGLAWAGEVDNSQKEAEDHAAVHALRALQGDAALSESMASTKKPKGDGNEASKEGEEGGEKKEKKKREPIGDLPRTRLSEDMKTGVIENWRPWGFGWIEMEEKVEHEVAAKNRGRVYLNKKDWANEEPPEKGQAVKFLLYADDAGFGAESCSLAE